jgi:nicotinate phosphoribosyltransferase
MHNGNVSFRTSQDVKNYRPDKQRFFSASHDEIRCGATADVYFVRTQEVLGLEGKDNTVVTAEIFASRAGVMAGTAECLLLLRGLPVEVWAVEEGETFQEKETVVRIIGPYSQFGPYETALLGILASSSGWATAARECHDATPGIPFVCFGARHIHPAVAPVMERAAIIGGAAGAACVLGAKLAGQEPVGTIPHALVLIMGDTVKTALAYNRHMPKDAPRTILVDTFHDEAEEALRVAQALGKDLAAIRLDTPSERGGVTEGLVKEVRARLDQAGFSHVKIFVSGGVTPERMAGLAEAGVDAFGIGSYITAARPIDMTMDVKAIEGRPIAKRGRIPGPVDNPKLKKMQ